MFLASRTRRVSPCLCVARTSGRCRSAQLFAMFSGVAKDSPGVPSFRIEARDEIKFDVFKQSLPSFIVWGADNTQFKNYVQSVMDDDSRCGEVFNELCTVYGEGGERRFKFGRSTGGGVISFPDLIDWAIRKAAEMEPVA